MDWSQRVAFAPFAAPEEGQKAEGGTNWANNCVAKTVCTVVKVYGGPHIEPQELTDAAYGPNYRGYLDYGPIVAEARKRFPALPEFWGGNPVDTLGVIDQHARLGHAIMCSFWSDPAAVIKPWRTGILHVSNVVEHQNSVATVLNAELNSWDQFSDHEFQGATAGSAGELGIFLQAIPQPAVWTPPPPLILGDFDMATIMRVPINIHMDDQGRGGVLTEIPWGKCIGGQTINGTDPDQRADGVYPPNRTVEAQERDGKLLVEIIGAAPNSDVLIWQDVLQ